MTAAHFISLLERHLKTLANLQCGFWCIL